MSHILIAIKLLMIADIFIELKYIYIHEISYNITIKVLVYNIPQLTC